MIKRGLSDLKDECKKMGEDGKKKRKSQIRW